MTSTITNMSNPIEDHMEYQVERIADIINRLTLMGMRKGNHVEIYNADTVAKAIIKDAALDDAELQASFARAHFAEKQQQPSPDRDGLIELLKSARGVLAPVADQDWHGKWRIQRALELVEKAIAVMEGK